MKYPLPPEDGIQRFFTPAKLPSFDWREETVGDISNALDQWCRDSRVTHVWDKEPKEIPLDQAVEWTSGISKGYGREPLGRIPLTQINRIGVELVHGSESLVLHVFFVEKAKREELPKCYMWGGRTSMFFAIKGFENDLLFAVLRSLTEQSEYI